MIRIPTQPAVNILCALIATCTPLAMGIAAASPPNIIFIMADDLGYGDLGCFGQTKFETPHLDRLASRGLRMTQHYAGSTVCAPSRCALMTGLHTGHCQVRGNQEARPYGQMPIAEECVTIAEILQQQGYVTGAFGKWGLGYDGSEGDPLNQGFDEFFGYKCQRAAHRYYPNFLWQNDQQVELDGSVYSHDRIFKEALAFISQERSQPFFCYLPVTIPHAALEVPEAEHQKFRDRFPDFESKLGNYSGVAVENPIAAFAAMVTKLDRGVGHIVQLLEDLAIAENTLIVFTSDNGPHSEGGHNPKFFASSGPWRGKKRDLYEGGIRMPTIAYWPGIIAAGRESDHLSAAWDWLPTLAEIARSKSPVVTDGLSLVPTLRGEGGQQEHEYLYWEFHERGGKQAIRQGKWKAIRLGVEKKPNGPVELYNLESDPSESNNVAMSHPEVAKQLAALMSKARTPSEVFQFTRNRIQSPRIGAAAKALAPAK